MSEEKDDEREAGGAAALGMTGPELRVAPYSGLDPADQLRKKALFEEDAAREAAIRRSRFLSRKVHEYMAEWPFPGPHSTPSWWVTCKPAFPDWQEPRKMSAFWTPREPRGMAPFEVYLGHHFCGTVTRWCTGEWVAWRSPDEVEEFPSLTSGRHTGKAIGVRRTRSRAVRALLDFHRSGRVEPEVFEDVPRSEKVPGSRLFREFTDHVADQHDKYPALTRGQAFCTALGEWRPGWAFTLSHAGIAERAWPASDNRLIPEFLRGVRWMFRSESVSRAMDEASAYAEQERRQG